MVPGVLLVSSAASAGCTVTSGELGTTILSRSLSNIGFSYSHSHALAYKSSCLMITSGSGCHSRGVTLKICERGFYFLGDLLLAAECKHIQIVSVSRHWLFLSNYAWYLI